MRRIYLLTREAERQAVESGVKALDRIFSLCERIILRKSLRYIAFLRLRVNFTSSGTSAVDEKTAG